ncbi:MAG: YggT family protein [Termitinemataceae bacterium]|nr:MAG: YggT family protein [Termitinemataceae bacterium]
MLVFKILALFTSAYSFLIFIRILLSWFTGSSFSFSKVYNIICSITDPYLNWFNHFNFLRIGNINFSPILALAVLSVANNIFFSLDQYGHLSIGALLFLILNIIWSALSFVLGFFIIILILRLIAYAFRLNIYNAFWQTIDAISKPVMQKISSILFKKSFVRWSTQLISAIVTLIVLCASLSVGIKFLGKFLISLPI